MLNIGCHLSSAKGYLAMGKAAVSIGADTFQFFTRNPRGTRAKAIKEEDVEAFKVFAREHGIHPILAHAPYILNPASADEGLRRLAAETMADDLARMEYTPGNFYNFHPGCHVGQGVEKGIEEIAGMLNQILKPEQHTVMLLETMAGKGTEIGGRFEELRQIMDQVVLKDHVGVCLDTCHVWDGGYDIAGHLDQVIDEFDRVIGLSHLKAIHLNDSQNPLGARKDRHARIGEGCIGKEALGRVVCHPALKNLPFYLETPNELDGYAREIEMMRQAWASEEAED
ncbi:MAG TPA: deoxyribonuclease IV [Candidatus Cottocaccamicrobium excrementipullorum]|nr:deoxyribonuclease IV [Candidatus Cottocaccamicrobium excrementipullorum]